MKEKEKRNKPLTSSLAEAFEKAKKKKVGENNGKRTSDKQGLPRST